MRIMFLGLFGCGNFGNDASLEALSKTIMRDFPMAELVCCCPGAARVTERLGLVAHGFVAPPFRTSTAKVVDRALFGVLRRVRNVGAAFFACRGVDVVITPGTGLLDDFQDRPLGWPFMLLRWCVAARLRGARVLFLSIGAGPIVHPISRQFMFWAARLAHVRSYRDKGSRDFMRSLGCDVSHDKVFPDLALGLPAPMSSCDASSNPRNNERPIVVGVGLMDYSGWKLQKHGQAVYQKYIEHVGDVIYGLHMRGHHVRLLIGDASDACAVEDVTAQIARASPGDDLVWLSAAPADRIADVMDTIAECDLVIATRFHNVVASLRLCRPTISLGYAAKNAAIMADFGLEAFCHEVENFCVDEVLDDVDCALAERAPIAVELRAALSKAESRLAEQNRGLAEQLATLC